MFKPDYLFLITSLIVSSIENNKLFEITQACFTHQFLKSQSHFMNSTVSIKAIQGIN
jgi:hypothetical protein